MSTRACTGTCDGASTAALQALTSTLLLAHLLFCGCAQAWHAKEQKARAEVAVQAAAAAAQAAEAAEAAAQGDAAEARAEVSALEHAHAAPPCQHNSQPGPCLVSACAECTRAGGCSGSEAGGGRCA